MSNRDYQVVIKMLQEIEVIEDLIDDFSSGSFWLMNKELSA